MDAHIHMTLGFNNMLYYNEEKVVNNEAECIHAGNFITEAKELNIKDKKTRIKDLTNLNPQTRRSGVSIVVEFTPGEKHPNDKLIDIARDLMEAIGFGSQPYLLYRHDDTAHQHMHIASTKIRYNGDRIPESFIGALRLQPAARAAEEKYHLARTIAGAQLHHDPREKIQYGKNHTLQAMSDTVKYVVENYRYRSVPELNAALRLYNLTVKGGSPGSLLYQRKGLFYQVLSEDGKPRNAPIKASKLPSRPTLKNLEARFAAASSLTPTEVSYTRWLLDDAVRARPATPQAFFDHLHSNQLAIIPGFDKQGMPNDLHFIDRSSKIVLSLTDLGVKYTPAAIQNSLGFQPFQKPAQTRKYIRKKAPDQTTMLEDQKTPAKKQKLNRGRHL